MREESIRLRLLCYSFVLSILLQTCSVILLKRGDDLKDFDVQPNEILSSIGSDWTAVPFVGEMEVRSRDYADSC